MVNLKKKKYNFVKKNNRKLFLKKIAIIRKSYVVYYITLLRSYSGYVEWIRVAVSRIVVVWNVI